MIKYTIDLGTEIEYFRWSGITSIMYALNDDDFQTETLDDHLLTIF